MPFDNPKQRDLSKSTFELTLSRTLALIDKHKQKYIPIFLMGDFNSDINRNNRFDLILKKFISDNNLLILDNINDNHINRPTFSTAQINGKIFSYNLDHFLLFPKDSLEILKYPKFSIFEDLGNTSDHQAINFSFTIETLTTLDIPNVSQKKTSNTLSLENPEILNFYQIKIQENLKEYSNYYKNPLTIQNDQTYIDQLYSSVCKVFIISADQTLNFQKTLFPPKNTNEIQAAKSKNHGLLLN